jgi:dihydrodipicolinate synthase/N-acetylneuraminate lyase
VLKGVIPMLPTPFNSDKDIVWEDLTKLIENQISMGAHGISALGLGGEASFLTNDERRVVTEYIIKEVAGRLPVIVGVGAATTQDSCNLADHAASNGVTAIMLAPRPIRTQTQDDLFEYFTEVSKAASGIEVMLQDAPEYLGIDLNTELIKRLSDEIKNIAYIKSEKTPVSNTIYDLKQIFSQRNIGLFGGQAAVGFFELLESGGTGTIPGCEATSILVRIWDEYVIKKDNNKAMEIFEKVLPFFVFEMQSLEMFIKCTKTVLFRKGLLSSNETRNDFKLSPIAQSILDRHILRITEIEKHLKRR